MSIMVANVALANAENFDSVTGKGVKERVDGRQVALGKKALRVSLGIEATDPIARGGAPCRPACVPIAAGVLDPFFGLLSSPIIAAAAMSLSPVSVVGDALRLRRADV